MPSAPANPLSILTPKQRAANKLLGGPATHVMLRGGSRSGKTFLILRAIVWRALKAPKSRHAVFRFRFNHAKASIWMDTLPKVLRTCFPTVPVKWDKTNFIAVFPNGAELWIGGLDDKERVEKILGLEFATLYFNEASQISWASIEMALSRLAQNIGLKLRAYYDCNPPSKLHWSYQLFKAGLKPGTKEKLPNPDDYAEMQVNPSDNAANLPPQYFDVLGSMSQAKRLRFEAGEWASEVNGALWTTDMLDRGRAVLHEDGRRVLYGTQTIELQRIVVSVDPSGTKGDGKGDDIGIVVAGIGTDRRGYVLEDLTCQLSPERWAKIVIAAYHRWRADRVVAERNFGGALVEAVIRGADRNVPYREVTASRGKVVRAEPVAALYERDQVSHVGYHADLEDQLCAMTPAGYTGDNSPDRADAAVWALTDLMLDGSAYDLTAWS